MRTADPGRRPLTAAHITLALLFVATALFLVPTLALRGLWLAAAAIAFVWLGGLALAWWLLRRELDRRDVALAEERAEGDRFRALLEQGNEAFVVLDTDGTVRFSSANTRRILGTSPIELAPNGRLLAQIQPSDRRRALRTLVKLRREPGATVTLELRGWQVDGSESFLDVRATNLTESPTIGGILVTLRDITPRKTFESEIQHLAFYDALTGLANRRFFFEQGGKALALARRHKQAAAVLYIDLDRFKQVNDTLGHEHGDDLLKQVADALRKALRDTDVLARLGGDEFAVILTEVRDEDAAGRVATRVLESMPASMVAEGHEVAVGASIGIAMYPSDGEDLEALLKAADLAMYRAKSDQTGLQFYRPELRQMMVDQLSLEQDMKRALEHHEFHLHYQPVYNIMTGEMVGAEALSRWRHFTRGMVAASEFIQFAEKAGLIRSLDRWAIARAIHQRKTLLENGWVGWVAVNLSPSSLTDPTLAAYIRETLEAVGLEPGALVLELPEDAVVRDPNVAADLMWELKNTGAAIALDDYGVGSTSLAQLKRLPIDILKLHPAFIRGLGGENGDEQLVEGTISIAHGIRAKVLAKGVEKDEQVDWLRDAGCDFLQGYLIGAPVPAEQLGKDADRAIETVRSTPR